MKVKVQPQQSLWDVALMHAGSIESVFDIAYLNNVSVTDTLEAGSELELPEVIDQRVVDFYQRNGLVVATALAGGATISNWILATGVWRASGIWIPNETWKTT